MGKKDKICTKCSQSLPEDTAPWLVEIFREENISGKESPNYYLVTVKNSRTKDEYKFKAWRINLVCHNNKAGN